MYVLLLTCDCGAEVHREMCNVQRKQKEVEKTNNFYYQLLQKALPTDEDAINDKPKGAYHSVEDSCSSYTLSLCVLCDPPIQGCITHCTHSVCLSFCHVLNMWTHYHVDVLFKINAACL